MVPRGCPLLPSPKIKITLILSPILQPIWGLFPPKLPLSGTQGRRIEPSMSSESRPERISIDCSATLLKIKSITTSFYIQSPFYNPPPAESNQNSSHPASTMEPHLNIRKLPGPNQGARYKNIFRRPLP